MKMQLFYLVASLVLVAVTSSPVPQLDAGDMMRAVAKVPRDHLLGDSHSSMVFKLNTQLRNTDGLDTKPCESFTVESLINLQRTLFSSREPRLQETYESTVDNRRLSAVGVFTDKLEELENLWAKEAKTLEEYPELKAVARDGKCHEAVMWWVHHITDATKKELQAVGLTIPLLATAKKHTEHSIALSAPASSEEAKAMVHKSYTTGIGCSACHASGATPANTESKEWPEELSYNATAYGAFPFWDNTGAGCTWCDPALGDGQKIRVKYSAKLNSELLMHTSCGNMGWTGATGAPKSSPCNHLFNSKYGAFIYTPKSALSPEADGNFCCRTYNAGDSQFPGAVPKDWMRSMTLYKNKTGGDTVQGFSGDYYTGDTKYYWSSGVVQFWYLETKDGIPVEQGEGCSQPGVQKREACAYEAPIMLYHDYDPKSFIPESHSASEFDLPDVCKNTKVSCAAPGGDGTSTKSVSQYSPVLTLHGRMSGVGGK